MPVKIRHLIADLQAAGYELQKRRGKGGHRWFRHPKPGSPSVNVAGKDSDDAKPYLVKQVREAIKEVQE